MHRVGSAFLMIFVMLLFALPTFAQDSTPEATIESLPVLKETYTSADGLFSFQYPDGWTAEIDMPRLSIAVGNVPKILPADQIQAGEIDGAIFPDEAYDEICARFGMCSWIGLVDATPDTILDDMTTFFDGLSGTTLDREKLADKDTLLIYSTWDKVDQIAYIIKKGDRFTMLFFTGKASTLTDNKLIFQAIANSIQYKTIPTFAQDATLESTETTPTQNARDYCAGELTYDLPEGWSVGEVQHTQYGASVHIASSAHALDSDTAGKGEAVIIVSIIARSALAQFLDIDAEADVGAILEGVAAPVSMPVTADSITSIKIGDQTAGRMEVHAYSYDLVFIALDVQPDVVGLVVMAAPAGEIARWQATAIDVAESLHFDIENAENVDVRDCSA